MDGHLTCLGPLAIAVVLAGCASAAPRPTLSAPHSSPAVLAPSDEGVITGGLAPCEGTPIPHGPRYAAGTVDVLEAQLTERTTSQGVSAFFHRKVATQTVALNGTYRFDLYPGAYVIEGHYASGTTPTPVVFVTVTAGITAHVDLPNLCK